MLYYVMLYYSMLRLFTLLDLRSSSLRRGHATDNLRTSMMDFRGLDSSIILIMRGGILMSTGDFPESLSQAILLGMMLVGRLGVIFSVSFPFSTDDP